MSVMHWIRGADRLRRHFRRRACGAGSQDPGTEGLGRRSRQLRAHRHSLVLYCAADLQAFHADPHASKHDAHFFNTVSANATLTLSTLSKTSALTESFCNSAKPDVGVKLAN